MKWEKSLLTDRKNEHLDIVLDGRGVSRSATGFDQIAFEHVALPELDIDEVDLTTTFLEKRIKGPLLVSSMTGGPARAAEINRNIAVACQEIGVAFAVGSQRVALENGDLAGFGADLRRYAPDIPILANFGAAQLNLGYGLDQANRVVEMIGADALIIHLNPLQEAVQPEGDGNWKGLLNRIGALAGKLDVPLVVKEVGAGISGRTARQLVDAGVAILDVAGAGGTSWAAVESERSKDPQQAAIGRAFADWGIPTARAIAQVREACPDTVIVGSGGIRDGIDVAKAIRLGADVVGQAAGVLKAAVSSEQAVVEHLSITMSQLRIACFCTGSATLADLRTARLL